MEPTSFSPNTEISSEKMPQVPPLTECPTWIEWYYCRLPFPTPVTGALSGVVLFLIGLGLAGAYSFERSYVKTLIIYMACFGVSWVTACIRWAMKKLPEHLLQIRSCFLDEEEFTAIANAMLKSMCSRAGSIAFSVALAALAWLVAYRGLFGNAWTAPTWTGHLFPFEWYVGKRPMNLLLIDLYGAACALPLGTGLWLLIQNGLFLRRMRRLDVVPLPGVLIARFRRITAFYLQVSFAWFVGVGLLGVLFFKHLDVIATVLLLITGALGALTFYLPQFVFHLCLIRAAENLAEYVNVLFQREVGANVLLSLESSSRNDTPRPPMLANLANLIQVSQPTSMWVYDYKDFLVEVFGVALTLAPTAVRPFFVDFLKWVGLM